MEMAEHDAEVGDGFFDSEDDDAPVDMAAVYEGMKRVPLPDFDYAERAVGGAAAAAAPAAEPAEAQSSDAAVVPKDVGQGKKKGAGRARPLKRLKVAGTAPPSEEKAVLKNHVKGGGSRIATAAKVAAQVAPNVVTGGVVAEAGPRPDFSLWTAEDDLTLANAMEAGAAVEALAKGAMRFSHRFTVRELRERWRALLYDPELSAEASVRMVEAEAALSDPPPKAGGSQVRNAKILEQKRRSNSIRFLYHKRKRSLAEGKPISATESQTLDDGVIRESEEKHGEGTEKVGIAPLSTMPLGNVDPGLLEGLLSPKGGAAPDYDCTFTQMVSLLAAGGVGAVFGALPGNLNTELAEDQKRGQESRGDEPVSEAVITPPKHYDVETDQCQSETSIVLGGNDKLNPSAHVLPIKQEVLQLESVQLDRNKLVEEGEGAPQVFTDKIVADSAPLQPVADTAPLQPVADNAPLQPVADNAPLQPVAGNLLPQPVVGNAPIQGTSASPVTKDKLVCSPNTVLVGKGSETAYTGVKRKAQELSCSVFPNADPSDLHAEQLRCERSVKAEITDAEKQAETADVGCALGPETLHPHHALQESHRVVSNARDDRGDEGHIGSHVHWEHEDFKKNITEQDHEQGLNSYRDQEQDFDSAQDQDFESDQDLESEQHFSYIESDYDGEYYESADGELLYRSGSPDTLLDDDWSMLDWEPDEYAQAAPIDEIMNDPILGPVVCALSREDTEIPILHDLLPLPLDNYYSDGGLRDGFLLDYTSADDDADMPSSPSEFHVYEEWESSDALRDQVHAPRSGDDNIWDPETSAGKQGIAFPQSGAQSLMTENFSPNTFSNRPVKDEVASISDFDGDNQLIQFPVLQLQPSDFDAEVQGASSDALGTLTSTVQHSQWQPMPTEEDSGFYHGDIDPLTGQEGLIRPDLETRVLKSDEEGSAPEIEEEELESEADTRFSDVETMIMNMDLDPGVDDEFSALEESRRMYRRQRRMLVRLEQNFSSAMQRSLTKRKALAILYGRHLIYYMTKTEVVMGRTTQDNIVDIDLGKEGRANKVSRKQASLKLKEDGVFYLRNLGRRSLTVNNIAVDIDQRAILGSNCLIEVGGMCFIFEINKKLVKQQIERMRRDS
ncbi:hypothetical protein M758_3G149800 [Ceratodon purpureus]|nr:hypothetical protein M758_3G149800 [Ceratodon purpureus]